jgi:hypothetical protein
MSINIALEIDFLEVYLNFIKENPMHNTPLNISNYDRLHTSTSMYTTFASVD